MNDIDRLISSILILLGVVVALASFQYGYVTMNIDLSIIFILTGMNIFMMGWVVALISKIKEFETK